MKEWKRAWKLELIEKDNPEWNDLFTDISGNLWIPAHVMPE